VNWLASRQTDNIGEEENEDEEEEEDEDEDMDKDKTKSNDEQEIDTETGVEERIHALPGLTEIAGDTIMCAGFNGRCNKVADTCYSFWNGATLLVSFS
jgi:geranylgeranyl transferase type-1 subunit beta